MCCGAAWSMTMNTGMETDYNDEDVEQLRIRVEAFIELIKYGG